MNQNKHTNHFHKVLVVVSLLSFSMACKLIVPSGNDVTLADCYQITFLEASYSTDTVSTWRYHVEELACAQDLSNWMLELPGCASVVDASPAPWELVHPDPNYQLDGIKWQTGAGFEKGEFSVVLSGALVNGTVHVGVKGPDVAIGEIEGPVCDVTTATITITPEALTPTAAQTQTATIESTLPPTSTAPAATVPPPASSGTILITDNDQVLTFTCNGNAVEVRGNANTVTLLGSCGSITVKGNGNTIYYSGSPVITNTGNENSFIPQ